jgi:hypothetical protein
MSAWQALTGISKSEGRIAPWVVCLLRHNLSLARRAFSCATNQLQRLSPLDGRMLRCSFRYEEVGR